MIYSELKGRDIKCPDGTTRTISDSTQDDELGIVEFVFGDGTTFGIEHKYIQYLLKGDKVEGYFSGTENHGSFQLVGEAINAGKDKITQEDIDELIGKYKDLLIGQLVEVDDVNLKLAYTSTISNVKQGDYPNWGIVVEINGEDISWFLFEERLDFVTFINGDSFYGENNGLDIKLNKAINDIIGEEKTAFNDAEMFVDEYKDYLVGKTLELDYQGTHSVKQGKSKEKISAVNFNKEENNVIIELGNIETGHAPININQIDLQDFIDGKETEIGEGEFATLSLQEECEGGESCEIKKMVTKKEAIDYLNNFIKRHEIAGTSENDTDMDNLVKEYEGWIKMTGLPLVSADDLLFEIEQGEHSDKLKLDETPEVPSEVSEEKVNQPDYRYYIVNKDGKILTGWEYREDAKDFLEEEKASGRIHRIKTKKELLGEDINPDENSNWGTEGIDLNFIEKNISDSWTSDKRWKGVSDLNKRADRKHIFRSILRDKLAMDVEKLKSTIQLNEMFGIKDDYIAAKNELMKTLNEIEKVLNLE